MTTSAQYLPPGGKVPNDSEADEGPQGAKSNCINGCVRTLHHISHLLVPRKCQLLLQEKPFGDDVVIVPYSIAIGASLL